MSKKLVFGILISLLVVFTIGIIAIVVLANKDKVTPEDTLKEYMACIERKDYEGMYALTDGTFDKDTFLARNKNIYEGIEAYYIKIAIARVSKNNDNVEIIYTTDMYTVAGNINFVNTAYMVKEDGIYKIKWNSNLIYPELNENSKIRVSTLSSKRGSILDRNGKIIAEDGSASQIGLVPGKISAETKTEDIAKIANLLDLTVEYINNNITASYVKEDTFVPLKTVMRNEVDLKQKLLEIKGVKIIDSNERIYPYGEATSQLIGYVQQISSEELESKKQNQYNSSSIIGKTGLEKILEEKIRGIDGAEIYIADSNDTKIKTIANKKAQNGANIKLTIDVNLQQKVYEMYKEDKSATIIIDPKTGEIISAVSTPTFDSNDFSFGMSTAKWNTLSQDEDNPLFNRLLGTYTPGSSFKPVTGAIGLTVGAFEENDDFEKSGVKWQLNDSWGEFYITTLSTYSGISNLRNALIYSDNIYFAKAAIKIGKEKFVENLEKLGFNNNIESCLGNIKSTYSNTGEILSDIELANSGYGQAEMLVNPLHMAMLYSAFLNNGSMINTYVEYDDSKSPSYYKENILSQESVNIIKEDLIQVVENPNGTGYEAKTDGLIVGGKTGTAEIKNSKDDTEGTEIGWFNCFTINKTNEKQFLIISMVEDVQNKGGSHYVVNKVKKIIDEM